MKFGFIKKCCFTAMTIFDCSVSSVNFLESVSMNTQECKIRTKIIDINNNEPTLYPYSINSIISSYSINNDPYEKLCVPDVVKNINGKVFNLMSRSNERRRSMKLVNANLD